MAQFKSYIPETDFSYLRIFAPMTSVQKRVWRIACGIISGYTDIAHTSHKFFYEPRYIVFDKSTKTWYGIFSVNGECHQVELPR